MKLELSKEWFSANAAKEEGLGIGAGGPPQPQSHHPDPMNPPNIPDLITQEEAAYGHYPTRTEINARHRERMAEREAQLAQALNRAAEMEEELAAAMKAVKDLAGQLTRRDQDVAEMTGRLRTARKCYEVAEDSCTQLSTERDQLRLDVAELTGRLKERQMAALQRENRLLEQVRDLRKVAEEALSLLKDLSDCFVSSGVRWEWQESGRRIRAHIESWRMRLNAVPTQTGTTEGGAA